MTLGWDERHRRRIRLTSDQGVEFLLDLPRAHRLGEGDGLALDDGGVIRIIAAAEDLLRIGAGATTLARLAYHLGNRHLAAEILPDALVVRYDHVIAEMAARLGGTVEALRRPFSPEPGAYGGHDHE